MQPRAYFYCTDNPTGENDEKFVTYFTYTGENNEKIVAKFPFCVVSVPGRVFIISKFCIFYNVRGHVHIHVATHNVESTLTLKPTLNNVERGSHILQNFHKIVILPRDYITSIRRYAWQYEYGRDP